MRLAPLDPEDISEWASAWLSTGVALDLHARKVGGHLFCSGPGANPILVSQARDQHSTFFLFFPTARDFLFFSLHSTIPYRHCVQLLLQPVDHSFGAQRKC